MICCCFAVVDLIAWATEANCCVVAMMPEAVNGVEAIPESEGYLEYRVAVKRIDILHAADIQ